MIYGVDPSGICIYANSREYSSDLGCPRAGAAETVAVCPGETGRRDALDGDPNRGGRDGSHHHDARPPARGGRPAAGHPVPPEPRADLGRPVHGGHRRSRRHRHRLDRISRLPRWPVSTSRRNRTGDCIAPACKCIANDEEPPRGHRREARRRLWPATPALDACNRSPPASPAATWNTSDAGTSQGQCCAAIPQAQPLARRIGFLETT